MTLEPDIRAARILIVDDEQANVHLLNRLLTQAGYVHVTSTMDPTQVAELHRRHDYDLILLDLRMPAMDGFSVMEDLKAGASEGYLPVIVLTAQPEHKLRALQAGAKDFIGKPFDLVEVKTRIHNMLEVRLLYRKLAAYNKELEEAVAERTAELRESEARYRSLTELASDWYWEQDEHGQFMTVSGPVMEMLGLDADDTPAIWDEVERSALRAAIAARKPFIDFLVHRRQADGRRQQFRVSGQPMFDPACRFLGYRGVGVETSAT
jgi:PAS domain S-box-containing protein